MKNSTISTGERVPRSGTYRISHGHPIPDIRRLQGRICPACPKCSSAMQFTLTSSIPTETARERFRLLMQEESHSQHRSSERRRRVV